MKSSIERFNLFLQEVRAMYIYPYIDRSIEYKLDLINKRTAKATKFIYGSPGKLPNDVQEFYSKFI